VKSIIVLLVAACLGAALLASPATASAEVCPNEQLRSGYSASLPDCRAYEMVSPVGFEPFKGNPLGYQASVTGARVAFYAKAGAPPGSASFGPYYLSTRGSGGWSTEDAIPPQTTAGGDFCYPSVLYSPDLSKSVLQDGWNWGEGYPKYPDDNGSNNCSHDEPPLVSGEPRGAQNLFLRDNETPSYQLVNVTPPGVGPRDAWFQVGSSDFGHIVFTDPLRLTPEAPTPPTREAGGYSVGEDVYEFAGGVVRLVTLLPDGTPAWGLLANGDESGQRQTSAVWTHAVSADGERIFFYAGGELSVPEGSPGVAGTYVGGGLYLRENTSREQSSIAAGKCADPTRACTVQIDAAQSGAPGPSGNGHFQWATPDGSKVFFTDESKLTAESKAETGKPDLYEYDLNRPEGQRVADLTAKAPEAASVQGLSGISDDGSRVYFVAEGVLTGEQANSQGAKAQAGHPNLYLRHAGVTTFIATLDAFGEDSQEGSKEGDTCDWESYSPPAERLRGEDWGNCMSARVSPSGEFLAFNSLRSLTGYNNIVAATGERNHEIFLYEAAKNKLSCASCDPTGAPPTAEARSGADPRIAPSMHEEQWYRTPSYLQRNLSDTGQVFFDTQNRLLPGDTNGLMNVYEYQSGHLSLISSGTSSEAAIFRDASASGNDVFFITTQALVGSDTDNTMSLYDARVNGGFAEPPSSSVCEGEEACHGALAPAPALSSPGTASFSGPGNPVVKPGNSVKKPSACKAGFKRARVHGMIVCKRKRNQHKHKHKRKKHIHHAMLADVGLSWWSQVKGLQRHRWNIDPRPYERPG
jgi:hypothetical protein